MNWEPANDRDWIVISGGSGIGFAQQRLGDAQQAQEFYDDAEQCLQPEYVARTVVYAIQQPKYVEITQLVVLPVSG